VSARVLRVQSGGSPVYVLGLWGRSTKHQEATREPLYAACGAADWLMGLPLQGRSLDGPPVGPFPSTGREESR
jgi:hypothetical protein